MKKMLTECNKRKSQVLRSLGIITGLCLLAIGILMVTTGCSKDYDDQIKNIEETIKDNKATIEEAISDQKNLIDKQIDVLEKALGENIDAAKKEAIQEALTELNRVKQNLEVMINTVASNLDTATAALGLRIDGLKDYMDGQIIVLGDKIDRIDEKLNALTTRVSNLEERAKALEDYDKVLKGLIDNLDSAVAKLRQEMETADEALQKQITENLDAIKALLQSVSDLQAQMAADKAELEGKISAAAAEAQRKLDEAIQALRDNELNDLGILIDENHKAILDSLKAVNARIGANTTLIGEVKDELNEKIAENTTDIAALTGRVENLEQDVEALQGLAQELSDSVEDILERLETVEIFLRGVWPYMVQMATDISTMQEQLEELFGELEGLSGELGDYKAETDGRIDDIKAELGDMYDELIAEIGSAISGFLTEDEIEAKVEAMMDTHHTRITSCEGKLLELEQLLGELRADVDDLLNRIQSIIYVPDYSDGKITMSGLLSSDGESVIKLDDIGIGYRVMPASAAASIVECFRDSPASFSIVTNQVRTRAIRDDVVRFTIQTVGANQEGDLYFIVTPEILDMEVFLQSPEYSYQIALKFASMRGDEKMTDFTDLHTAGLKALDNSAISFRLAGNSVFSSTVPDPNDPNVWYGHGGNMITVGLESNGTLLPYDGLLNIDALYSGVGIADALGLDPAKISYVRAVNGQYRYQGMTNVRIDPKTLSFSGGYLSSDIPTYNYQANKAIVEVRVRYDGKIISAGNYVCLKFE